MCWRGDGERLVTCCADPFASTWPQVSLEPGVKVWAVDHRGIGSAPVELVASLDGREGCFHPLNGFTLLVAGSEYAIWTDDTLRLWDVSSLHVAASIKKERHVDAVTSLAFSRDDKRVASGSMDRTIRVWHTPAGSSLVDAPCAGTLTLTHTSMRCFQPSVYSHMCLCAPLVFITLALPTSSHMLYASAHSWASFVVSSML